MASTHTGPVDSLVSIKSTPDVEVNSLQINRDISVSSQTPQDLMNGLSMESVMAMNTSPTHNITDIANIDKQNVKRERTTADETIQQIMEQQVSPEKKTAIHSVPSMNPATPNRDNSNIEAIVKVPASGMAGQQDSRQQDSQAIANAKVSAYARLEFENFIFYVQTLQVVLGRKSENDQSHSVDVHLANSKAISRKHAKIFYNFGTERFELSIQGKNGAFVDDSFVERGATVPLTNKSKIQIGQIVFRFVLPGANPSEKTESPSKPINPSDAISLKSTLYTNQGNGDALENTKGDASPLTSKDFEPVSSANAALPTPTAPSIAPPVVVDTIPAQKKAKEKKQPRPPKPPKKVYTLEEIPEEYRTKPNCSYSNLIATCLRTHGTPKGMSLAEIYKSIRDIFPYYKYCPDGWQSSVRHNLSLNKAFRKVSKEGKGWLWGLDEEYCAEKERAKKKQAAAAEAKAKAAALKLEQQQQQQQQKLLQQKEVQMAQSTQSQFQQQNTGVPSTDFDAQLSGMQGQQLHQQQPLQQFTNQSISTPVKQDHNIVKTIPVNMQQQFQHPMTSSPIQPPVGQQSPMIPKQQPQQKLPLTFGAQQQQQLHSQHTQQQTLHQQQQQQQQQQQPASNKTPSIQAQLAANRGVSVQNAGRVTPSPQQTPQQRSSTLGADTKKALAHLQQQLVLLSKDLRTLVDKPTISAILTQAIAMTIAQVTQIAKAKGITSDPLATLIDTNPDQLTKILTVALNAATFKVTNGRIKAPLTVPGSGSTTRGATPQTSGPRTLSQVQQQQQQQIQQQVRQQLPVEQKQIPLQKIPSQQAPQQVTQNAHSQSAVPPKPVVAQTTKLQQQTPRHPVQQAPSTSSSYPKALPPKISVNQLPTSNSPVIRSPMLQQPPQLIRGVSNGSNPMSQSPSPQKPVDVKPVLPQSTSITPAAVPTVQVSEKPVTPAVSSTPSVTPTAVKNEQHVDVSLHTTVPETETSIAFDDLNDPEFDKVLESLSKEPTPGLDSGAEQKVIDDDELNRLLATDFMGQGNGTGSKRSFDEVDTRTTETDANKMVKTE